MATMLAWQHLDEILAETTRRLRGGKAQLKAAKGRGRTQQLSLLDLVAQASARGGAAPALRAAGGQRGRASADWATLREQLPGLMNGDSWYSSGELWSLQGSPGTKATYYKDVVQRLYDDKILKWNGKEKRNSRYKR